MNGGEYGGEDSDSEAAQKKAREERMIASLKKREEEVKEQMAGHLKERYVIEISTCKNNLYLEQNIM